MLLSFEIQNFRSILKTTINFESNEKRHPAGYQLSEYIDFLDSKLKEPKYIVPMMAIFGGNASGKTNLLRAFFVFKECCLKGIKNLYDPNLLNPIYNSTAFKIRIVDNKNIYTYLLEYNQSQILKEILIKNEETLFSITNEKFTEGTLKSENVQLNDLFLQSLRDNQLVFPFAFKLRELLPNLNNDLNLFCDNVMKLNVFPTNKFPYSMGIDLLDKIAKSPNGFEEIVEQLQKIDIDIKKMQFNPVRVLINPNNELVFDSIDTYHQDVRGDLVQFEIKEESYGTQTLFGLIGIILYTLKQGGILMIDELDRSLHFISVNKIINLFKDKSLNQNNAQLIFTAHSTDILEDTLIRASEISTIEKHLSTGSVVNRNNLRNVINFRLKYISGALGGLPNA